MSIKAILRGIILLILGVFVVTSCEETIGNVTPTADLIFVITDSQGTPVENAVVYLFPFKSPYEAYLVENPDGDDSTTPSIPGSDVAVSGADGKAIFTGKQLEGTSYASGTTFIHEPNPIYFRVQATVNDGGSIFYLTNDNDIFKISFDDLESGESIIEEIPVVIQ